MHGSTTPTCERCGMVACDRAPEDKACTSMILVTAGGKPRPGVAVRATGRAVDGGGLGGGHRRMGMNAVAAPPGADRGGERAGEHTALLWPRCRPHGRHHRRVRRPAWTLVGSSRFLRLHSAMIYCDDPCLLDGRRWLSLFLLAVVACVDAFVLLSFAFRLYNLARCCVNVLLVAPSLFYSSRNRTVIADINMSRIFKLCVAPGRKLPFNHLHENPVPQVTHSRKNYC
ncbi:uncharacterized protein LOC125544201 isoform X2 [Triticum urartu]|uniref:uncharacterized protein LOC125544201 isoform X2 n=1 Tax=Triticum urartu TaxID=4572 RepID=UPI0020448505|nr:uncharacterized protein LOC125544201 isoform X2 [Triticum urartu]